MAGPAEFVSIYPAATFRRLVQAEHRPRRRIGRVFKHTAKPAHIKEGRLKAPAVIPLDLSVSFGNLRWLSGMKPSISLTRRVRNYRPRSLIPSRIFFHRPSLNTFKPDVRSSFAHIKRRYQRSLLPCSPGRSGVNRVIAASEQRPPKRPSPHTYNAAITGTTYRQSYATVPTYERYSWGARCCIVWQGDPRLASFRSQLVVARACCDYFPLIFLRRAVLPARFGLPVRFFLLVGPQHVFQILDLLQHVLLRLGPIP